MLDTGWRFADMSAHGASWRSGYAEDCKSLHPGSIPGEASSWFVAVVAHATSCDTRAAPVT